jgi:hypothetical protein
VPLLAGREAFAVGGDGLLGTMHILRDLVVFVAALLLVLNLLLCCVVWVAAYWRGEKRLTLLGLMIVIGVIAYACGIAVSASADGPDGGGFTVLLAQGLLVQGVYAPVRSWIDTRRFSLLSRVIAALNFVALDGLLMGMESEERGLSALILGFAPLEIIVVVKGIRQLWDGWHGRRPFTWRTIVLMVLLFFSVLWLGQLNFNVVRYWPEH